MAARRQYDIAVRNRHRFVRRLVFGENPLNAESLRGVEAVVIGFFQMGHIGKAVLVMPVRRTGRPVALRREHLGDQQAAGGVPVLHGDRMDGAGAGARASLFQPDIGDSACWGKAPAGTPFASATVTAGQVAACAGPASTQNTIPVSNTRFMIEAPCRFLSNCTILVLPHIKYIDAIPAILHNCDPF